MPGIRAAPSRRVAATNGTRRASLPPPIRRRTRQPRRRRAATRSPPCWRALAKQERRGERPHRRDAATKRRSMKRADIEPFFATLRDANPEPSTELDYTSVFELLAAVLLSAQATDRGVNKATRRLFPVAGTPQRMLALGLPAL